MRQVISVRTHVLSTSDIKMDRNKTCLTWAPGIGAKGLVGLRTGWLYIIGCGAITGTPPI